MKVIFNSLPLKRVKCIATVGVFDGIHLGHQYILKKVRKAAEKEGLASLVITFDIPPQQFLTKRELKLHCRPEKAFIGCLTEKDQKTALISSLGLDYLWFLKTRESLLRLSAQDFINYIQKYFKIERLIVGEDFRFGHQGGGDLKDLRKLGSKHKFQLSTIKKKSKNEKIISSSLIRKVIQQGQLKEAKELLGRNFSLTGRVFKGKGLGRKLGFPTANIRAGEYVTPAPAVYAAWVIFRKKVYPAAVNVGFRPTLVKASQPVIEAHILNFGKNILGKTIKIVFLVKIRNEQEFSSLTALGAAISKDIATLTTKYSALGH
ncbi:MAG: bifunctional riboflavin kinase/FAD synthetase [Candidatus Omnitrophota bacterium]